VTVRSAAGEASSVLVGVSFNPLLLRCLLWVVWSDILCNLVLKDHSGLFQKRIRKGIGEQVGDLLKRGANRIVF